MRRPLLAVLAAAAALAGCGGGGDGGRTSVGPVHWDGEPLRIGATANLPDDRIVGGRVVNDSLRTVKLVARDLELETADGRRVSAALAFIDHYAHGIFPPSRRDRLASEAQQEAEDRRLGRVVEIEPGASVPLTFAWRQPDGAPEPVRVRWTDGSLPIPKG